MDHNHDHGHHDMHAGHQAAPPNFTGPSVQPMSPLQAVVLATLAATTVGTPTHQTPGGHNHGQGHDSSHGGVGDMHMAMYFHTGFTETILFKDWAVSSVAGMVGSVVGVFFMAALYEALKYFREHLFRLHFSSMSYSSVAVTGRDGRTLTEVHQIVRSGAVTVLHRGARRLREEQVLRSCLWNAGSFPDGNRKSPASFASRLPRNRLVPAGAFISCCMAGGGGEGEHWLEVQTAATLATSRGKRTGW
ncbi:copper transporter 1A isoform X1 [Haemaphysalis longicornis]